VNFHVSRSSKRAVPDDICEKSSQTALSDHPRPGQPKLLNATQQAAIVVVVRGATARTHAADHRADGGGSLAAGVVHKVEQESVSAACLSATR